MATDPVNSVLSGNCGHVQGWRVHESTMYDSSTPVPLGEAVPFKQMLWINQRMDGKTPEFYSRNWYIHGGHLDGEEAESESSRAYAARHLEVLPGCWYHQNRVLEPVTPTAWVVHGFADLLGPGFIPGPGERYNPKDGLGEESFDRWPPRRGAGFLVPGALSGPRSPARAARHVRTVGEGQRACRAWSRSHAASRSMLRAAPGWSGSFTWPCRVSGSVTTVTSTPAARSASA